MPKLVGTYGQIVEQRDDSRAALGEIVAGTHVPRALWPFHRKMYYRYDIVMEAGEYRSICLTLDRGLAEQVNWRQNLWAVRLRGLFIVMHVRIICVRGEKVYGLRPIQSYFYERMPGGGWAATDRLPEKYREKQDVTPVAA